MGVDADLLPERGCGRGHEQGKVADARGPETAARGRRRHVEDVDGLPRPVVERRRNPLAQRLPELRDGSVLADHHPRLASRRRVGKPGGVAPGRDEVRADVAEGGEPTVLAEGDEPAQTATGDVLQEDALNRVLCAEREDVVERRPLDQPRHARRR